LPALDALVEVAPDALHPGAHGVLAHVVQPDLGPRGRGDLRDAVAHRTGTHDRDGIDASRGAAHGDSHSVAMPWPTPMHIDARPRLAPRRFISWSSVTTIRAPEQPTGWPSAIAPPLTLTMEESSSSCSMQGSAWAANAS